MFDTKHCTLVAAICKVNADDIGWNKEVQTGQICANVLRFIFDKINNLLQTSGTEGRMISSICPYIFICLSAWPVSFENPMTNGSKLLVTQTDGYVDRFYWSFYLLCWVAEATLAQMELIYTSLFQSMSFSLTLHIAFSEVQCFVSNVAWHFLSLCRIYLIFLDGVFFKWFLRA